MAEASWVPQAITAAAGAFGGLVVAIANYFNQSNQAKTQRTWDREEKRIQTYNKVLKMDGEVSVIRFINGENAEVVNIKNFTQKIRPILYENFHLLDEEIRLLVHFIDKQIKEIHFIHEYGAIPTENERELLKMYCNLIQEIKDKSL